MKSVAMLLRIPLWIIAVLALAFGVMSGCSSGAEWFIALNHSEYIKEDFVISGTRQEHSSESGNFYFLKGSSDSNEYEFEVSLPKYEQYSTSNTVDKVIEVYRKPGNISGSFQGESLTVIFADEWREQSEVAYSAKTTMVLSICSLVVALAAFLSGKYAPRLFTR